MDTPLALMPVRQPVVEILGPEDDQPQLSDAAQAFVDAMAQAVANKLAATELTDAEKGKHWAVAFEKWLTTKPGKGQPRPISTQRAYAAAWADFRAFCPKPYWHIEPLDVAEWVADLRQRTLPAHVAKGLEKNGRRRTGQVGLSDATVNQMIVAISAFYSYAARYQVRPENGGHPVPLFTGMVNPAKNPAVERPTNRTFGKSIYLEVADLRKLLQAIKDFESRNRLKSLRDYALFLTYISTAARNSEVRTWRWGDLERRGSVTYYRWANKGKAGLDEVPADAWEAVQAYLEATGRLTNMEPNDYVFTPLTDNILRIRHMDPAEWDRNRPLSSQEVNRCLRQHARNAGLDAHLIDQLHVHVLRHSGYMLYRESGLSLEERSRLLHHSSLAITTIYDHAVAGQRNLGWARASRLLDL